jgi:putative hydrolase of the HAD superfamily
MINTLTDHEIKVIGFDADDTLWENEDLFFEAQNEIKNILKQNSKNFDKKLLKTEKSNLDIYGYGIKGFILSIIETYAKNSHGELKIESINQIIKIGKKMLSAPVNLIEDVERILRILSKKYELILITKGDLLDQERKIKKSKLEKYFKHKKIVSEKNKQTYRNILDNLKIEPQNFLMVGNSFKSDVFPVLEIGGNGIHIPYKILWEHESIKTSEYSKRYIKLEKISDLISVIN